jgi:amino acid transporter
MDRQLTTAIAGPHSRQPPAYRWKNLLLGPPLATSRLLTERLRKVVALAVFSSDAISSTAYGTEQIMLVLVAAGAVATGLAFPIAVAIGGLLAVLILSYRQTITAYPSAGGAYVVSRDNLGPRWALVAGSALLIDYVLTVAVSVTSGVAALTTALPSLQRLVLPLSLAAIGLIMWTNLRGVRESGRIFAVPTYLFVGSCAAMLLVGLGRLSTGHRDPVPAGGTGPLPPATASVGVLLVLHAFAAGCTALTGVEAISNGVPAFRPPEARNARRTLVAMGVILGSLFVGVSFLAVRVGVRPYERGNPTLIGQLAGWVLGGSVAGRAFFYLFQAATLAILVLAANTSFAGFPRLVSFAAADAFLPRWFTKRGQRLVYANGVLALSVAAAVVTLVFRADYNRMLPLYAIGVFTSFTFSQAGMTRRHLRLREPGWRYGIAVNGTGALVTFLVLLDIIGTKSTGGAWIVLLTLPLLVLLLDRTNRAYAREREEQKVEAPELPGATQASPRGPGAGRRAGPGRPARPAVRPAAQPAVDHRPARRRRPRRGRPVDQGLGRAAAGRAAGGGPLPEPRPGGLRHRRRRRPCPPRHRGHRAASPPRRPGPVRAAAARPDGTGPIGRAEPAGRGQRRRRPPAAAATLQRTTGASAHHPRDGTVAAAVIESGAGRLPP